MLYNVDNILDWRHLRAWPDAIRPIWRVYVAWCAVTIPAAGVGVTLLLTGRDVGFAALMLGLGIASLCVTWLTRKPWKKDCPRAVLWSERLFVSLVWALACVLVPVHYADQAVVAQTLMTVAYVWHLSWTAAMVWDLTSTGEMGRGEREQSLSLVLGERAWVRILKIGTISASILALVDILLGYFPWYNVSVLAVPLADWILLSLWPKFRSAPQLYCNLFFFLNTLCSLFITAVYVVAEAQL
jgi:hypothetical protein